MHLLKTFLGFVILIHSALFAGSTQGEERLSLLFLGDQGPHQPRALADAITPILKKNGIDVTYTEDLLQLNLKNLKDYSGLILYANIDTIPPAQERDLLQYVAEGGGFIPLHCASFCFRN